MTDWVTTERRELKAVLLAADTDAGDRVESEQNDPVSTHPLEAANELPKLCVYAKEDSHEGNGNSTTWETTAVYVIDVWAWGIEQADPPLSAREIAADARDELVSQVLGATTGNPAWIARFERITKAVVKRNLIAQGALIIGVAQVTITVRLSTDHGLEQRSDLVPFEESGTDVTNALDPTGAPLTIEVELEQDGQEVGP